MSYKIQTYDSRLASWYFQIGYSFGTFCAVEAMPELRKALTTTLLSQSQAYDSIPFHWHLVEAWWRVTQINLYQLEFWEQTYSSTTLASVAFLFGGDHSIFPCKYMAWRMQNTHYHCHIRIHRWIGERSSKRSSSSLFFLLAGQLLWTRHCLLSILVRWCLCLGIMPYHYYGWMLPLPSLLNLNQHQQQWHPSFFWQLQF